MAEIADFYQEHAWVVQVFGIVLLTAVVHYIAKLLFERLARKFEATHNLYDDALLDATRRPLAAGIWVMGISLAAQTVGGDAQAEIFQYVGTLRDVAVVWLLVWFALRFIKFVEEHVVDGGYRETPVDQTTAKAVGKLLRATVLITGVLLVLQAFGFSISGVLAFGGIRWRDARGSAGARSSQGVGRLDSLAGSGSGRGGRGKRLAFDAYSHL